MMDSSLTEGVGGELLRCLFDEEVPESDCCYCWGDLARERSPGSSRAPGPE
jgi:hypothetical protein